MPYKADLTTQNSRLPKQIMAAYNEGKEKPLSFAQMIDKHWTSKHSIDTILEDLTKMLPMVRLPRSTFAKAIQIEVAKAEAGLVAMKFRLESKTPGNPKRKVHSWQDNRRTRQGGEKRYQPRASKKAAIPVGEKMRALFHCDACEGEYIIPIQKTTLGHVGLLSHVCSKCGNIGKGFFQVQVKGETQYIVLEADKDILGLYNEKVTSEKPE